MKTRTEVVNFLVSRGVPQNLAKASVNEIYSGGFVDNDNLYGYNFDSNFEDKPQILEVSEDAVIWFHEIAMDSLTFVKGGIAVYDKLIYDMNGDLI
jgi:hypothetical protein